MTPTEAAREIVDAQNTHVRHNLSGLYGPDIARALLDAEERNAALKGALVKIKALARAWDAHHVLKNVHDIADKALTPEGGAK